MIDEATRATPTSQAENTTERRRFFVSRHPGAIEWARRYPWSRHAELVPHLDVTRLVPGDTVIGTLPVHLAAAVCARGAKYLHLALELSAHQRGQELTADELEFAGAHLIPYEVRAGGF